MLGGSFAIPVSLFWMAWTSYVGPLCRYESLSFTLTLNVATYQYLVTYRRVSIFWLRYYHRIYYCLYV